MNQPLPAEIPVPDEMGRMSCSLTPGTGAAPKVVGAGNHSPKAQAFWARKAELRKSPMHCGRCAQPHDRAATGQAQCPACRAYAAEYRAEKRQSVVTIDRTELGRLERRVANLEHYFARLSTAQTVAYKRGYVAGRRLHRKASEAQSYRGAMPTPAAEDLRAMSHAYTR